MELFEVTIALLFVAALLSTFANRIAVPYPTLLALAGAGVAFVPGVPQLKLDPDLVLALFVAPVLLDAAYDASPRDLRRNFGPVVRLALAAVVLTVAGVAVVAKLCLPDLPWWAAIALGAIVAPPDAAAATAVLRPLKPPHRIMVVLEGESLFNDATALIIYRLSLAAGATGSFSVAGWAPTILLAAVGSVLFGWVMGRFVGPRVVDVFPDNAASVLVQFLCTFFVWIAAEALSLSPIITMVIYGITIGRITSRKIGGRQRIAFYAVWEVVVFVLNAFAFLLIGLQMREVVLRLGDNWSSVAGLAAAVCLTVIGTRLVWVMVVNSALLFKDKRFGAPLVGGVPTQRPTHGGGLLISWAGMRGIVTLATALALPEGFPARDALVFTAVCVVLATLGLQGLTLGPLLKRLGLSDEVWVEEEAALARRETARAALQRLTHAPETPARQELEREYRARLAFEGEEPPSRPTEASTLQTDAVTAQRDRLEELRRDGTIGDAAYHLIEEEIDLLELSADPRVRMA